MKTFKILFISLFALLTSNTAKAQCTYKNTAFKSGESLHYNLYYNWSFVWVKAGTATFDIVQSTYDKRPAYKGSLITRGSKKADKFFILRDTLLCYNSLEMAPLYYRKGAHEGKRYTVDEVFYSYPNGKCHVRQHRRHNDGTHTWVQHTYADCVYDMMSIFMRARSFNPTSWKKGTVVNFPIADGVKRYPAMLRFNGKTNVKADNGHTYRCLKLSYIEREEDKTEKTICDFFVSDDDNHVPVRLDLHLKFGSAKAFMTNVEGLKSPMAALII